MKNNKGLSDVVSTVLIILLVVAAVAGIWLLVKPLLDSSEGSITKAQVCLTNSVEVKNCKGNTAGTTYNVTYSKATSDSSVSGISKIDVTLLNADGTSNSTTGTFTKLTTLGATEVVTGITGKNATRAFLTVTYNLASGDGTAECVSPEKTCN